MRNEITDWAQKLIEEIKASSTLIQDTAAVKNFVSSYENGDSAEAYDNFVKDAEIFLFDNNQNSLILFSDESAYVDWEDGTGRFYADVRDMNDFDEIKKSIGME